MIKTYSKINPELLLNIVCGFDEVNSERNDITEAGESLQCAILRPPTNKVFKPHKHLYRHYTDDVKIQESFIVMKGSAEIDIFDIDDLFLCTVKINTGDLVILLNGGHSLKTLNDESILYEIKTGPYEGQIKDKIFIAETGY